jgi:hypothetical protein
MTMTWFKVHHEIVDDIKIRRFTSQEKWAWITLLCLASKSSERGTIDADEDDIADYCEFNCTQDWLYYRDKLIVKGMIEINPSGNLTIVNWHKRQDRKPSDQPEQVKKRVAASRAKKKAQSQSSVKADLDVTPCNAIQVECNANVSPQTRSDQTRSDQTREENTRSEDIYTPPVENFSEPCQPTKEILIADMVEEKETPIPPTPLASLPSENSELAIAKTEKPKSQKKIKVDPNLFLEVWLQDSPRHWIQHRTIDSRTIRQLINFANEFDNSLEIFQKGLWFAQTDTHWCMKPEKRLGMSNVLSENLIFKFYQRYEDQQARSQQLLTNTDRPMTASDINKAEKYLRYKEALTA